MVLPSAPSAPPPPRSLNNNHNNNYSNNNANNSGGGGCGACGSIMNKNSKNNKKKKASLLSIQSMLTHGLLGLLCFYLGIMLGMSGSTSSSTSSSSDGGGAACSSEQDFAGTTTAQQQLLRRTLGKTSSSSKTLKALKENNHNPSSPFPPTLSNMFVDFTTVDRVALNDVLEIGVPLDDTKPGAEDALILYTSTRSLPRKRNSKNDNNNSKLTATQAVENCRTVKVILMETAKQHAVPECLAILPQWESYHVHKFMRLPPKGYGGGGGMIDPKARLRYVSRSHDIKGRYVDVPEYKRHTLPAYGALAEYLGTLDNVLTELKPLIEQVLLKSSSSSSTYNKIINNNNKSSHKKSRTIIVQVCNYGQVELFHNFICNARAKGLDYSRVFIFATDEKTYELCQQLGIPSYYNPVIFGDMPEMAARGYGDRVFSKMMMAKVYCVHLVLSLGYNVLFQDVDLVWYQNPLPYLESEALEEWDLLFQDDGARSSRYAPYSPNTGFYFVRYSPETLFFFGMLLRSGDTVAKTTSHQAALTALLTEHVSWKGLRVKVFKRGEENPFPGGVEYHRFKDIMKQLLKRNQRELEQRKNNNNKDPWAAALAASSSSSSTTSHNNNDNNSTNPLIFHMSWTKNKDNKKLFFEQMGEWYLKDHCSTGLDCCLAEPKITCHYRDKPSLIPCRDSPPIDAGKPSFW